VVGCLGGVWIGCGVVARLEFRLFFPVVSGSPLPLLLPRFYDRAISPRQLAGRKVSTGGDTRRGSAVATSRRGLKTGQTICGLATGRRRISESKKRGRATDGSYPT